MHLRINSHNIIIHPPDLNIHVIDFSLASSIKENKTINFAEWGLELSYIAPEQTGHLNKKVDQRTDLYSLGIVLYELWSGFPPFRNENAADTIHDHLVKLPTSLDRIRPETPPFISLMVENY
ncbi:MAG: protein kinase [Saprospiraceae bacterium]|nr:protein kinase [Saprospiraceae bacterium]